MPKTLTVSLLDIAQGRRDALQKQLGTVATLEFLWFLEDPTPATAAKLSSIWITTLYRPVLNAWLRNMADCAPEIRRALVALDSVRQPGRENHGRVEYDVDRAYEDRRAQRWERDR